MPQPTNPLIRIAEDDVNTPSTGLPNKKEPSNVLQTIGWDKDQIVAGNHLNYILDNLGEHITWLQEQLTTQGNTILDQGNTILDQGNTILDQGNTILEQQIKVDGFYLGGTVNPATHLNYGIWFQVEADITLRSATSDGTVVSGDNTPVVPLPEHTHASTTSSNGAHTPTASQDSHSHNLYANETGSESTNPISSSAVAGDVDGVLGYNTTGAGGNPLVTSTTPVITVDPVTAHTHTTTIDNTGTAGVTVDIRGRHLDVVMWKRTA